MEMIITAATVATMFFNSATSESNNYFYNAQMEDGKVETLSVMKNDCNMLTNKLQYRFVYDSQDRLSVKEALLWNERSMRWEPDYRLDYAYAEDGFSVSMRKWNKKKDEYGEVTEKMDYAMVLDNVMAINHYECVKGETMELKSNMLVMNPDERLLSSKWTAEVF